MVNQKVVAVDTEILIWGIQKRGANEDKYKQAEYFLTKYIKDNELLLLIPTIVVGEYLVKVTTNEEEIFNTFLENCIVVDYDLPAARIAAKIWALRKATNLQTTSTRFCINADCKIIATAKAHGAEVLYTENKDMEKLAKLIDYPTKRLPEIPPQQGQLFF